MSHAISQDLYSGQYIYELESETQLMMLFEKY